MLFATVTYTNQSGAKFDFEYYMKKHIPMVERLLSTSIEVTRGIGTPDGAAAPFVCVGRIRIKSIEEFSAAMARYGAEILGDVPRYTNLQPAIQFDEVLS
jgi:uncharacterized protein (TIGR02118 family)